MRATASKFPRHQSRPDLAVRLMAARTLKVSHNDFVEAKHAKLVLTPDGADLRMKVERVNSEVLERDRYHRFKILFHGHVGSGIREANPDHVAAAALQVGGNAHPMMHSDLGANASRSDSTNRVCLFSSGRRIGQRYSVPCFVIVGRMILGVRSSSRSSLQFFLGPDKVSVLLQVKNKRLEMVGRIGMDPDMRNDPVW